MDTITIPNLYEILEGFNLESAYSYVLRNNLGNNLPYHNFGHIENVTLFAYMGCIHESISGEITRNILLAALFHDFNHSGGKLKDIENITLAKAGLNDYLIESNDTETKLEFVNYLIDITEFPYTIETSKLTIHQKILRDADIIQSFFLNNYMQDVVLGLAKEMNKTPEETVDGQLNFISNLSFGTEYANKLYNERKLDILSNLILIQRFLK
jgi:hypothetical protein